MNVENGNKGRIEGESFFIKLSSTDSNIHGRELLCGISKNYIELYDIINIILYIIQAIYLEIYIQILFLYLNLQINLILIIIILLDIFLKIRVSI